MGIYGQDWASYQADAPDTSGLGFAFVKVTEGLDYVNPRWESQSSHARANGLVWGAYHYPHMGNSPQAEADRFLALVDWQPGDLIVLDWEGYDSANTGVSNGTQLAYKEAWLRYVKQRMPHNPVGMYCNVDYWERVDTTGYYGDFLWIATAGRAAGDPGIRADWLVHQYGGDGDIDLDFCHLGSVDELRAWALAFAGHTPEEDDMPTADEVAAAVWNYSVPVPRLQPDGSVNSDLRQAAMWPMVWGNVWAARSQQRDTALQGAVASLAGLLAAQHTNLTAAEITAAVEAGIANSVVQVHVDVTQPGHPA